MGHRTGGVEGGNNAAGSRARKGKAGVMKVRYIGQGDIVVGFDVVLSNEFFNIDPGHFPALTETYGADSFKVVDGPSDMTGTAPEAFVAGDVAPAKVGRPKKL
jgi:hypothetical protein